MPEEYERGYESTSLRKGLKEDLRHLQKGDETYSEVIQRALLALREKEDRQESRYKRLAEAQQQQARLLVRVADEIGLEKEYIPRDLATMEADGVNNDTNPLQKPQEATVDVFGEHESDASDDLDESEAFDWDAIPNSMPSDHTDSMTREELAAELANADSEEETKRLLYDYDNGDGN